MLLMLLYALLLGATCQLKYSHFGYDDFDLAIHTQSLGAILRGSSESSILGIPFLGNHMVLILYLIAPLYKLFPSATLLLYIQTLVLAAGAWAVFSIARRELSPAWGLGLAAAYLVYPPLIYLNLYEFHPIALAVPFVLYAMLFWKRNAFGGFLLMLILAACCQENISLLAVGFGVFALLDGKRWWWAATPIVLGISYFAVIVLHLMPKLNDTVNFQSLYAHLGDSMPEVAATIVRHPLRALRLATEPAKLGFLTDLFAPLGFLSVLSPLTWVPAGLILAQRLLSNRPTETSILFHYQAEFIPFVFVSAIHGIRRLQKLPSRALNVLPRVLIICFPVLALLAGGATSLICAQWAPPPGGRPLAAAKQACVRQIPRAARVAATFEFLAPLADHPNLVSLHHISSGYYTLSVKPYPIPDDLDFIVLDTNDRLTFSPLGFYQPTTYERLQLLLNTGHWQLQRQSESLIALRRAARDDSRLPLARPVDSIPATASTHVAQEGGTGFALRAFEATTEVGGDFCVINLFWVTSAEPRTDADMLVTVRTPGEALYETILSPGSRFWPPQSWPSAAIIRDRHRVPIRARTHDSAIRVKMLPMTQRQGA